MGYHGIVDIKGFECRHDDPNACNLSLMLECDLNEGKEHLEEIEDEDDERIMLNLYDKIVAIDGAVCEGGHIEAVMSDARNGSGPMAIGWGDLIVLLKKNWRLLETH